MSDFSRVESLSNAKAEEIAETLNFKIMTKAESLNQIARDYHVKYQKSPSYQGH